MRPTGNAPTRAGIEVEDILDALPELTVLLDSAGVIVATNRAWREAATSRGCAVDFLGRDYLAVCQVDGVEDVARGIEAVLQGRLDQFERDYGFTYEDTLGPVSRSYQMVVRKLASGRALVQHTDVTDARLVATRLRQRKLRLGLIEHVTRRFFEGQPIEKLRAEVVHHLRVAFPALAVAWCEPRGGARVVVVQAEEPVRFPIKFSSCELTEDELALLRRRALVRRDLPLETKYFAPVVVGAEISGVVVLHGNLLAAERTHAETILAEVARLLSLIEAQRRLQEELVENHEVLEQIVATTPIALAKLAVVDQHFRFEFLSRGVERIVGVPAGRLLDSVAFLWERILREDLLRLLEAFGRGRDTHRVEEVVRVERGDGVRWVRWTASASPGKRPGELRWSVLLIDVHEVTETLHQLNETRTELAATIDAVPEAILLEDRHGRVVRANRAAARLVGRDVRTLPGQDLSELLFGATNAPARDVLRRGQGNLVLPNRPEKFEVVNYRLYEGGRLAWVHVVTDVTLSRQRQAESLRFRAAIEQASDAIVLVDASRIDYANPAAKELGITEGRSIRRIGLRPVGAGEVRRLVEAIQLGKRWKGQALVRQGRQAHREDRWFDTVVYPIREPSADGNSLRAVLILHDTTDSRRAEALEEAVAIMDNIGLVFSSIRHELGNPVNSIKTALALVRRNLREYSTELVDDYLARVQVEIGRVEYLLRAFKAYNMFEHPRLEPTDLGKFLGGITTLFRKDLDGRGVRLSVEAVDEVHVSVDPRALHQVLLNLVANAVDAAEGQEDPQVRIWARRVGSVVELAVADNGPGMTSDHLARSFRPFYTSKPTGTGLGLAIVQRLSAKMGGTLRADSVPGRGTTIVVTFAALEAPLAE